VLSKLVNVFVKSAPKGESNSEFQESNQLCLRIKCPGEPVGLVKQIIIIQKTLLRSSSLAKVRRK
jgi:hypothetical protein